MKARSATPAMPIAPTAISPFSIARLPRIEFGNGRLAQLPDWIRRYGQRCLLVTGAQSFQQSRHAPPLYQALQHAGIKWQTVSVSAEPSPLWLDQVLEQQRGFAPQVVVGLGGGSALDAAKALAGLLALEPPHSVLDFLEGVGPQLAYPGPALPLIAVPTTAGTGSEATKNAVLGISGEQGYKKSFRHDTLVPELALLDPELLESCPPAQIAANAMDALTQLMESYVSLRANPLTDALVESGIRALRDGLWPCYEQTERAGEGRGLLAYAALLSGICLAQTGLGAVHGLAAPIGALFAMPHGQVCGTLAAVVTRANIVALRTRDHGNPVRLKYAQLGNLLSGRQHQNGRNAREALSLLLEDWVERLHMPRLSAYGLSSEAEIAQVVAKARGSSMLTNPILLSDAELADIVRQRL